MTLAELTSLNASFSRRSPGLQLAVDSHSLGEFKTCPRRYYYSIVWGYQPLELSVHLTFGLLIHGARERYDRLKSEGREHEEALELVLGWVLEQTWDKQLRRPWFSGHPTKNRMTLIRTIIWYLDKFGQEDNFQTVQLASGRPAVELKFNFDSGYRTEEGESWTFCGYIDRIAQFNGKPYILDLKTTAWSITASWFDKFTPFNQFSMYTLAGQVAWKEPVQGLIVDGIQVAVSFSFFQRGLVPRPQPVIDEWYSSTGHWLQQMQQCSSKGLEAEKAGKDQAEAWPMNEMSCGNYSRQDGSRGGCEFRPVCGRSPASREAFLAAGFKRRVWDPLQVRGDI